MMRKLLPSLLAGLLLAGSLPLQAQDAPSQKSLIERGKAHFAKKEFKQAYDRFFDAFEADPTSSEINFWMGRSAFEAGDFESAVMAFERMLISDPEASRVELELARSYFHLGLMDTARNHFQNVLSKQPPEPVARNIGYHLEQISLREKARRKHRFFGSAALGLSWDTNARVSPENTEIDTLLGPVFLTGAAADEDSDLITTTTFSLIHRYKRPGQGRYWETSAIVYSAFNKQEDDLDLNYLHLSTGPLWDKTDCSFSLQAHASHISKDYATYQTELGASVPFACVLSKSLLLMSNLRLDYKEYKEDADRHAVNASFELRPILIRGRNQLTAELRLEHEDSNLDYKSYNRAVTSLQYERKLPANFSAYGRYRFQYTSFKENDPLFSNKQKDRVHEFKAGLRRQISPGIAAELNHAYTKANSDVALYEYTRDLTSFIVTVAF